MKTELCPANPAATEQLRPEKNDRSGIGVHYVDAMLKPLTAGIALPDGTKFSAKRRGLKITLACALMTLPDGRSWSGSKLSLKGMTL